MGSDYEADLARLGVFSLELMPQDDASPVSSEDGIRVPPPETQPPKAEHRMSLPDQIFGFQRICSGGDSRGVSPGSPQGWPIRPASAHPGGADRVSPGEEIFAISLSKEMSYSRSMSLQDLSFGTPHALTPLSP